MDFRCFQAANLPFIGVVLTPAVYHERLNIVLPYYVPNSM